MRVRKVRRKCGVRGCKNINAYSITLASEFGNSVIICKDCLEKALGAIEAAEADAPPAEPVTNTEADAPPAEATEFVCPHCGQVCKSELGLQKHIEAKHKDLA